jgi:hypothetical protein
LSREHLTNFIQHRTDTGEGIRRKCEATESRSRYLKVQGGKVSALLSSNICNYTSTSDTAFITYGSLTSRESYTAITDRDAKPLATKGEFLNESIVDMLVT